MKNLPHGLQQATDDQLSMYPSVCGSTPCFSRLRVEVSSGRTPKPSSVINKVSIINDYHDGDVTDLRHAIDPMWAGFLSSDTMWIMTLCISRSDEEPGENRTLWWDVNSFTPSLSPCALMPNHLLQIFSSNKPQITQLIIWYGFWPVQLCTCLTF